jgi:hypothetical protein
MTLRKYSNTLVRKARHVYGWVNTYREDGVYLQLVKKDVLREVHPSHVKDNFRLEYPTTTTPS